MLQNINNFFNNIGRIYIKNSANTYHLTFSGVQNCLIIKHHFELFPLMTYKLVYFLVWCQILNILQKGEHKTMEGLLTIVSLKAQFKKGLSPLLKSSFLNLNSANLPIYSPKLNLMNAHWLAGFITADGHFSPGLRKVNWSNTGYYTAPEISISQDNVSLVVLNQIVKLIGIGNVYADGHKNTGGTVSIIRITGINNINLFISFCSNNSVSFLGTKALDYADFCKIINIINNKEHTSKEGIKKIIKIVNNINSKRLFSK
jgi:hypothetical protein